MPMADRAFQRADTLSGGQQQRVAVARALLQRPEVLLADEPVASLDPDSAWQVMDLLRAISREDHLTVLCSLHQVELALDWGDRVIGLRSCRTVLDLPTAQLDHDAVMAVYARGDQQDTTPPQPAPETASTTSARRPHRGHATSRAG